MGPNGRRDVGPLSRGRSMSEPLVVIDADVLGRRRTGDESYVSALLAELAKLHQGLRLAAVTRRPELVPEGVEPVRLDARSQVLRMSLGLPRLLHRLTPRLAHFQHVVTLGCPCPAVVTVHDLSFERHPELMSRRDRLVFRTMVPRSVRRAARVLAVSEWTKRDHVEKQELAELYRGAACLVFPSRYEGFGLPVVEAMASGTPVVATAVGSIPEVAGDAAVLVEPGNPVALAGGIERALADREGLVYAGLERVKRYSWAETARRTLDVYRELV